MNNFSDLLAMLKLRLGVTDTARDAELTAILNGAIVLCENYLDDIIDRREVSEQWLSVSFPKRLRYRDPDDFVSLTVDGSTGVGTWKIVNQDAYGFLTVSEGPTAYSDKEVLATYEAGFETAPYDLMLAICEVALFIETRSDTQTGGIPVSRETITGIGSVDYDTKAFSAIPVTSRHILDMYRRPRI